ncbi:MAG TPA: hypothetical protein V6D09_21815 [Leptolyngbyaceae cyanobacterium]
MIAAIRSQARQHRHTFAIVQSHGIHAQPISFSFKLARWLAEVLGYQERLTRLRGNLAIGKIFQSGNLCQH